MTTVPSWLPPAPKLCFVAEAPGRDECYAAERAAHLGKQAPGPLVGVTGVKVHTPICEQLGIDRWQQAHVNVFDFQLPENKLANICVDRTAYEADLAQGDDRDIPLEFRARIRALGRSPEGYLPICHWHQLVRLYQEIESCKADVVVCLGKTAVWALFGHCNSGKLLGHITPNLLGLPTMVTHHPSYCLPHRNPAAKDALLRHYRLAWETAGGSDPRVRVQPEVRVPETVGDVRAMFADLRRLTAVDIETAFDERNRDKSSGRPRWWADKDERARRIAAWDLRNAHNLEFVETIQFSQEPGVAYVLRLFDGRSAYWSEEQHVEVYKLLRWWLQDPAVPKAFQRGQFDVARIATDLKIYVRGWEVDTLIQSHARDLGEPKDLSTIASRHLVVPQWWIMRKRGSGVGER